MNVKREDIGSPDSLRTTVNYWMLPEVTEGTERSCRCHDVLSRTGRDSPANASQPCRLEKVLSTLTGKRAAGNFCRRISDRLCLPWTRP